MVGRRPRWPGHLCSQEGGEGHSEVSSPPGRSPCLPHAASQRGSQNRRVFGKSGLYSVVSVQFQTERQTLGDVGKHSEGVSQCLAPLSRGLEQPVVSGPLILYSDSFTFRMERDAAFTQKKAERACLRVHLREKYRLPKVRLNTINRQSFFT